MLVARASKHEHRAHLGVEVALISIELLDMERRAVVRVGGKRRVGLKVERFDARPRANGERVGDGGVQPLWIGVAEEVRAGELLFEVTVDLSADLPRRSRPPLGELLDLADLQTRIGARGHAHAGVFEDVEDQQMNAIALAATHLQCDFGVEETSLHAEVFELLNEVTCGARSVSSSRPSAPESAIAS